MEENSSPASTPLMPSRREINGLLDEHKGAAYVWKTLRERYGPPKNAWGGFCKLVMREHRASSNASIGMGINGAANAPGNAQSNAAGNAIPSNSGSKTGNAAEDSTPSIPMRIARERDAIISPHWQLPAKAMVPDAEDLAAFQRFVQQLRLLQQLPAQQPLASSFVDTNTLMRQTFERQVLVHTFLTAFHTYFPN